MKDERHETIEQSVTDCNHLGNAAKMREALESVRNWFINRLFNSSYQVTIEGLLLIVNSALNVPSRNCDVLSKDEVLKVLDDRSFSKEDTIEWLYSEAKGETK